MDGPMDYHTKWSQSDRERRTSYDIVYMWDLNYGTNKPIYKTDTDSQTWKTNVVTKKKGGDKLGIWD